MAGNNIQKLIKARKSDGTHSPATEYTRDIFETALDAAPMATTLVGGAYIGRKFRKAKVPMGAAVGYGALGGIALGNIASAGSDVYRAATGSNSKKARK